jgi:hypothetical protein
MGFPYARRPTPIPNRPLPPLPVGVERVFTSQGLDQYGARPVPNRTRRKPRYYCDMVDLARRLLERMDSILCTHRSHSRVRQQCISLSLKVRDLVHEAASMHDH